MNIIKLVLPILLLALFVACDNIAHAETHDNNEWWGEAVMVVHHTTAVKDHDSLAAHTELIEFNTMQMCEDELAAMQPISFPVASYIPQTGTSTVARCVKVR